MGTYVFKHMLKNIEVETIHKKKHSFKFYTFN